MSKSIGLKLSFFRLVLNHKHEKDNRIENTRVAGAKKNIQQFAVDTGERYFSSIESS